LLVLNSPSNPTGVTYAYEELERLIFWAFSHDIFVIADEIYDRLVYDPAVPASAAPLWLQYPDKIAVTNGLSKAFAMTGWRVGYTLADKRLIAELSKIQGQTTSNVCSIAQKAGIEALSGSYDELERMRQAFQRRRDAAWNEIASWPGVICPKPDGAFYIFPDISAFFTEHCPDAAALCTLLLERANIAVMPGDAFGEPNCIRLSYAVADDVLIQALEAIKKVLLDI
jgi:aspartate aminotransferase